VMRSRHSSAAAMPASAPVPARSHGDVFLHSVICSVPYVLGLLRYGRVALENYDARRTCPPTSATQVRDNTVARPSDTVD